jgi:hypothetical protein
MVKRFVVDVSTQRSSGVGGSKVKVEGRSELRRSRFSSGTADEGKGVRGCEVWCFLGAHSRQGQAETVLLAFDTGREWSRQWVGLGWDGCIRTLLSFWASCPLVVQYNTDQYGVALALQQSFGEQC